MLLVIADSVGAPAWVHDISPFAHLAPVPLTKVGWPATMVMIGLAAATTATAMIGYRRRDLRS